MSVLDQVLLILAIYATLLLLCFRWLEGKVAEEVEDASDPR